MAGRRYKPALYELLKKGAIKPDEKGKLQTPKWFYGRKSETVEPVRKGTLIVTKQAGEGTSSFPVKTVKPPEARPEPQAAPAKPRETVGVKSAVKAFSLRWERKKLKVATPYWVAGLVLLGLLLSHLVMYRMGQSGEEPVVAETEVEQNLRNAGPSADLDKVMNSPVRKDVLGPLANRQPIRQEAAQASSPMKPEVSGRQLAAEGSLEAPPEVTRAEIVPKPVSPVVMDGSCLVMCGHENHRALRPVQEYFNQRGVTTEIGRFNNRYVVYSKDIFESSKEANALKLKNQVAQFGMLYNSEKPRGALGFTAETFRSAYWVRRDRIKSVDN
jgi:hypothetical protein